MNFAEARLKYGKEIEGLSRPDFHQNFASHWESKIKPFCEETNLDFGEAANLFSPMPEKHNGKYRPMDATIDLCAYEGHRLFATGGIDASPACDFFSDRVIEDRNNPSFVLGVAIMQNIWRNVLDAGNGIDPRYARYYDARINAALEQEQLDAAFSRSDLNRTMDQPDQGMLETDRRYRPRLRIIDVIARNQPLNSRAIEIPIVVEVGPQAGDRGTANRNLPRESMGVDETTIAMSETGRELEITDVVRRSSSITIQAIAEHQANRALREENKIVNGIINIIGTNATIINWPSEPKSADLIELHMTSDDDYMMTTFAGDLEGVVKYADIDPTYASDAAKIASGNRSFIDTMMGAETIAKRKRDSVPVLAKALGGKAAGDPKLIIWDRPNTFMYYTERGGTISDMYREEAVRAMILRNVHTYGGRLKTDADHCRWVLVMAD